MYMCWFEILLNCPSAVNLNLLSFCRKVRVTLRETKVGGVIAISDFTTTFVVDGFVIKHTSRDSRLTNLITRQQTESLNCISENDA
jgi:hypothetical protein